jgi:hypothetical protein
LKTFESETFLRLLSDPDNALHDGTSFCEQIDLGYRTDPSFANNYSPCPQPEAVAPAERDYSVVKGGDRSQRVSFEEI